MLSRDLTKFITLGVIFLALFSEVKSENGNLTDLPIKLGVDCLSDDDFAILKGKKIGLITNQSGVNRNGVKTRMVLADSNKVELVALYTPEHGLDGDELAGKWVSSRIDPVTGLTAYSLYGKSRKPSADMLKGVDALVFDIQDVGARCYTYISTMGLCMDAAAEAGIEFIILDRPNPVGGTKVSGPPIERKWQSFVGQYPMPFMHGMTVGEIGLMAVGEGWLKSLPKLTVIKMKGWSRSMSWQDTKLRWIKTSPNIPRSESCYYYLASCLAQHVPGIFAGTGTLKPFQFVVAEKIDHQRLCFKLNSYKMPGIRFFPYIDKDNSSRRGVRLEIDMDGEPDLMLISIVMLKAFCAEGKNTGLDFLEEAGKSGLNLLYKVYGSNSLSSDLNSPISPHRIASKWDSSNQHFKKIRSKYLLYD
ncbi:MAG: DUF1343 domain-containing protein [Verrucomicrobiales bacterium]|nr:DUF1343 domain-containing protein [Verrucomicrobiales bacterium]